MWRAPVIAMLLLCWLAPTVSAAAGDDVGDDRIVLVGSVLVDREETAGDVVVVDGDVTIRGEVLGDVVVVDGDVAIRGSVGGDVVTLAGQAMVGRRGSVAGDLRYADDKPVRTPGSQVGGEVKRLDLAGAGVIGAIGALIAFVVSFFVLGLVLLLLAPRAAEAAAVTAQEKALVCVLVGLVAFFLIPLIAFAALFTAVGIPLGIVLGLLVIPLYAISYVTTAFVLGRRIIKGNRFLAFLVGLLILELLTLIPILGGIIGFLAVVFGLGVLIMTLLRARA